MSQPKESHELALARWADLEKVQKHYSNFGDFLDEVITGLLGFVCTDIQLDIGEWVAFGPQYRMVQAQRGQAKTTITAAYAVWRLIHEPSTRVLIVSSGEDMAVEIANWIIQIIGGMPELSMLRPDRAAGDRESVTAYDIHHSLKGPEKSPSIACIGITSNMQGKRADLLIADDIESTKNSQTAVQRARLVHLSKDFSSICSKGDILWLGTPQSTDSIYNGLPGRGFQIRIWTGRYPTVEEETGYGAFLAPMIRERMRENPALRRGGGMDGTRGQPIDPALLGEEALAKKEIDQGAAYFQLQHMLSTKLSDEARYPLKVSSIRFLAFDAEEKLGPMSLNFVRQDGNKIRVPDDFPCTEPLYRVNDAQDYGAIKGWHMYVDPAGGGRNGDETAYAVTGFLAGRVLVAASGAVRGGLDEDALDALTEVACKWKPYQIDIEKNFGNGALAQVWKPRLLPRHACGMEDVWETGQKELRIIDVLEPVIGSGKLIVHEDMIRTDWIQCQKYASDLRQTYSLFWQISRITRDKGSLIHDDRLDALAGSVRHWVESLAQDDAKARAAAKSAAYREMTRNPLGNGRKLPGISTGQDYGPNALTRHGRAHHLGHIRKH
jgi:hypothetical protein